MKIKTAKVITIFGLGCLSLVEAAYFWVNRDADPMFQKMSILCLVFAIYFLIWAALRYRRLKASG